MTATSPHRRHALAVGSALAATALAGRAFAQTARPDAAGDPSPYGLPISPDMPFEKRRSAVRGSEMAYVDAGSGPPLVFLHGNPTSSYLWRNVVPHVIEAGYRAVAPDLIGMGDSAKPEIGYTYAEHAAYLFELLTALELRDATLVVHDWGSVLGMHYARENPREVRALAYLEAIVPPGMPVPSLEAMPEPMRGLFTALRTPGEGETMVLENNAFVEEVLPEFGVARRLGEAEMAAYRAPYPTPASRVPTLVWPRQIPIGGEPADVVEVVRANGEWLGSSDIPKLLFWATPGALMPEAAVRWHVANVPNLETRFLGAGLHFLQEDHPHLIGRGLADWLRRLDA